MDPSEELTVIIPSWNREDLLGRCLASLASQRAALRVLVVDNGSTDGTRALIAREKQRFPLPLECLRLESNLGFAAAANRGIRHAQTPFLALLNNDTEVDAGWAASGIRGFSEHRDYCFFASRIMSLAVRDRLDSAGDCYDRMGFALPRGRGEPVETHGRPVPVLGASAAAAFYRRELFDEVGFFDESFFMYLEDMDLSLRAQLRGHRCLYLPDAVVYHREGASTRSENTGAGDGDAFRLYWITRNRWQLMIRYQPPGNLPWLTYGWARSLLGRALRGPGLGAFLRGLRDGIRATGAARKTRAALRQTRSLPADGLARLLRDCQRGG